MPLFSDANFMTLIIAALAILLALGVMAAAMGRRRPGSGVPMPQSEPEMPIAPDPSWME